MQKVINVSSIFMSQVHPMCGASPKKASHSLASGYMKERPDHDNSLCIPVYFPMAVILA